MAVFTSISKCFKKVSSDIDKASKRAANRASVSVRAKYQKDISQELGLPAKTIGKRARLLKLKSGSILAGIDIGVQVKMPAHLFKPGRVKVMSSRGKRYTATYTIKGQGKIVAQGAFLGTVNTSNNTNKLILQRTGNSRLPVKVLRTDVFLTSVQRNEMALRNHLVDTFKKNFTSELNFQKSKSE